jgi:hypothetical protein
MYILHHCDNPPCVNPAHLFLGTLKDNTQDMLKKGRDFKPANYKGEQNPRATLSEDTVREIRRMVSEGQTQAATGRRFNVTRHRIWDIVHNRSWTHLT